MKTPRFRINRCQQRFVQSSRGFALAERAVCSRRYGQCADAVGLIPNRQPCPHALKIHFGAKYCYPDSIGHPGTASNEEALRIRTMWKDDTNEQNFLQMPPVKLTAEESAERSELMAQVDTFAKEMMVKYITGAESLDNFDSYIDEVNDYGLTRATEITQAALDRFLGQ